MVGDGHAMSVSAQILQHVFGTAEGAFGVDHPVLAEQQSQPTSERFRLGEAERDFHGSSVGHFGAPA